jgi:hypothetical protein
VFEPERPDLTPSMLEASMRQIVAVAAALILTTAPLAAQTPSRFYFGASTGAEGGARGPIWDGTVPSAGALVGVRVSDAWSVEVELDRGFWTTNRTSEAVWLSFAPPNSTYEEIQRLGIRARFERTQKAGPGFGAHLMWRSRDAGRVNVGLFAGVSARAFNSRVIRTTVFVPPELNLSPDRQDLQRSDETRDMTGGGPTAGLVIFVRVMPGLTVAPELRCAAGIITDDPYRVFRGGVRMLWSF